MPAAGSGQLCKDRQSGARYALLLEVNDSMVNRRGGMRPIAATTGPRRAHVPERGDRMAARGGNLRGMRRANG